MEALTLTCRVTAPGPDSATVSIGRRHFAIGRPMEFDDATLRVSALEYAVGAIGGEIVNGLRLFAARRRLPLDAVEALVTAEVTNGLTYLEVVGEEAPPRLNRVRVTLYAACDDRDAIAQLLEQTLNRLPLVCTLRTTLDLRVDLVHVL